MKMSEDKDEVGNRRSRGHVDGGCYFYAPP